MRRDVLGRSSWYGSRDAKFDRAELEGTIDLA